MGNECSLNGRYFRLSGNRVSENHLSDDHALRIQGIVPGICLILILLSSLASMAESCRSGGDIEQGTRNAMITTGQRYFDLIAKGDSVGLRQSAIPSLAGDFSGIEATVKENQPTLAGARATARPPFLLEAEGTAPLAHAEFFCGVFGSTGQTLDSAVFSLNNLPAGKYGVVILDVQSAKGPYTVSLVLQQLGSDWKLGGLYIKAGEAAGHGSEWFSTRAREFQAKGKTHNAWLFYMEAQSLASPLPFMSTAATDKLYDDSQKLQPADFPTDAKSTDMATGSGTGATTYKLTAIFPEVVGNDLDLVVRYQVPDIADSNKTYASNVAVMKAVVAKYPELRDAFTAVVARAVDPGGHDYGTLLRMSDIK